MPGSDDDFSNLEDINEDDEKGNYIHINNKMISVVSIYQYSNFFLIFFRKIHTIVLSYIHLSQFATTHHSNQTIVHHYPLLYKHLNH